MTEQELFVLAEQTFENVVRQIGDDQWDLPMPPEYAASYDGVIPSVRQIVSRVAYDDSWVPDMLAGRTMAEAGADKFRGDLLGSDPKAAVAQIVARSCTAALALEDLQRTIRLSFGDYPAREYFWQIQTFRTLPAHDLAVSIGADATLPPELVQALWDAVSPDIGRWRQMGAFPPPVPVAESAPLQDRFLGLTGRHPSRWRERAASA